MSKLSDLTEKLEGLRAEMLELEAVEEPTDEQMSRMDALPAEFDTVKTDYDAEKVRDAKRAEIRSLSLESVNTESGFSVPNVITRKDPFENVERTQYLPPSEVRDRALAAFGDDVKLRGITDEQHEALVARIEKEGVDKNMRGIASHVLVHGSDSYRSAFDAWFQAESQGHSAVYTTEESLAVRAAMALGGSTGGYVLPTLLDPTLIHTGTATKNPFRSISRIVEGTQNVWHGVSVGNVTAYWTAEAGTTAEGSPTFSNPSVTAGKLTAYLAASYEIFEDSDLQAQLPGLIGEAFSYKESTAFVSGSGTNAPNGLITAISATAASTVTATTRGAFTSASAADIFAVVNAVTPRYEDTATWLGNKATFNTIRSMSTASQGSFFWTNFNNAVVPGAQPLLGSPVVQSSDMATAQTSGTILLVLGDFSQYVIYDRIGTSVEFMQNVIDQASGLPTQQRGLVAHKRVGAGVTDINAFRFLKT